MNAEKAEKTQEKNVNNDLHFLYFYFQRSNIDE
jgi:hypothetical protein